MAGDRWSEPEHQDAATGATIGFLGAAVCRCACGWRAPVLQNELRSAIYTSRAGISVGNSEGIRLAEVLPLSARPLTCPTSAGAKGKDVRPFRRKRRWAASWAVI